MRSRPHLVVGLVLGVLVLLPSTSPRPSGAQSLDLAPPKPEGPPKIQSSLWKLAAADPAAKPAIPDDTADPQEPVVVILVPYHGQGSAAIDTTSFAGLGVTVLARSKSLMRVSVPPSSLMAVSELPGVSFVRRPYRPYPQGITLTTLSEGAALINALANHEAGVKGQGVKVAIIDDGFAGARDLAGGDLPATLRYHDFTGQGIYAGESVHGTGCAEIVHDVAPEAELWLYKTGDWVDFENAKDRCILNDIDIVSHSASWPATGFADGRGWACDIVNDAADNGILWVNAAGNYARKHYVGEWYDSDSDGWHNFRGQGELLSFEAEQGDTIEVVLTWDDWPTSRDNYDLYLYSKSTSDDLEPVAESTDIQSGSQSPREYIEYGVERSGGYAVAVRSENTRTRRLRIRSFNHDLEEYAVAEGSISIPADARGAMAVGAIHPWDWEDGQIADYSSRGPTTDGRIKPDLAAPSGVSTASYGVSTAADGTGGYFGTSAAAPHVAGAAALMLSANPSWSREHLWNALVRAAVDIDAYGRDNNTGYGKLVLPVMQAPDLTPPRIASLSPTRARYGQIVTINGTGFGGARRTSRVVLYESIEPGASEYLSWSDTRIRVRIPTGARTGDLRVITLGGRAAARLTVTSPWIRSISPSSARSNALVTITGRNFGSARGSSLVRVGSKSISSYSSWSSASIRFRLPANTLSGPVTVRTSEGTSNPLALEVTSPYLSLISPTRVKPGDRLTLHGRNLGSTRGLGSVRFAPDVRPSSSDYATWSDRRIVVEVPDRARSGDVRVVTSRGSSGTRRIDVDAGPRISSLSPTRVRYNQLLTIRGSGFGGRRRSGKVVFFGGTEPRSSQYATWSDNRIEVRVPTGARTGNLQVVTASGSDAYRLIVTSPWVRAISPTRGRAGALVTVTGSNFGAARGSGSVVIGAQVINSYSSWSPTSIRFRIPTNTRPGRLAVRTTEGRSNSVHLQTTSPYLTRVSPTRLSPGDPLTLTGGNFGSPRGSGYVLFSPTLRPSSNNYDSWSNSRIVVRVPDRARSGDVKVVTTLGSSGTRPVEVQIEDLEPLPSTGILGYSPPILTTHPKSIKFGFEGIGEDLALTLSLQNDGEVTLLVNDRSWRIPESEDWQGWWITLRHEDLNSGQNVIEFRNVANQNRNSNYTHWQLKDVRLWKPFEAAKLAAGARFLSPSTALAGAGLGHPFPAPFNAEVTVPFTTAIPGQVSIFIYNLAGQRVRLLRDAWTEAGRHEARWDSRTDSGANAGSGVYWILFRAPDLTQSARLVLIR